MVRYLQRHSSCWILLQVSVPMVWLVVPVRQASFLLLLGACVIHWYLQFDVVQIVAYRLNLEHWFDFVRFSSFGELDSRLQQMD